MPGDDLPVLAFESRQAWEDWLDEHHQSSPGLWLKIAKKGVGAGTISSQAGMRAPTPRPHTARVVSGLTTSDSSQRLRFGPDSTQGAVFVQSAEHPHPHRLLQPPHP